MVRNYNNLLIYRCLRPPSGYDTTNCCLSIRLRLYFNIIIYYANRCFTIHEIRKKTAIKHNI